MFRLRCFKGIIFSYSQLISRLKRKTCIFLYINDEFTFCKIVDHLLISGFWFFYRNGLHILPKVPEKAIFYVKQMYLVVSHDEAVVQKLHAYYFYGYHVRYNILLNLLKREYTFNFFITSAQ